MTLKAFHERVNFVLAQEKMLVDSFFEAANAHPVNAVPGNTVIYIEDDPDQVSMFKTMMSCYSTLKVLPALSAEEGQRLIARKHRWLKCVVMDVSLDPNDQIGINKGLSLLSWIKTEYPQVCVIVLTSHIELISQVKSLYPDVEVHIKAGDLEPLAHAIESAQSRVGVA